ncbi:16S rRNA (adenine(1518)-N(6)/adenine(1519)-N(6))-dimethyltransferase RsmA [Thermaerobacter sp. PB12/4term]|uniref:16S rRNA (adenine(1518)-N(6)/adenine(1519)-N(6))- dimethyltransferase RsmA n=1 Tax=Thermaerobacter sp. PB12/4term TaxID=2293838 RepID=UPI000E32BC9B|nr:16S rRNA (adenine(1518)-N(6)/adenine(1519)-N(6))-dimethyltransferase RsmA [Thermaerobacter sp. PB12/4term]QIA26160.1 16S rRNA (adenine(1518)-N(6)/adenine(1519)-N(6))-dimethyltransferase RsmA [Thermaerobacter sp. PB12/4term]
MAGSSGMQGQERGHGAHRATHRAELRRWLERYGVRPSRRLGQNFLVDDYWAERIVAAVEPGPDDLVIEVGPGLGALTERLAQRAGRVRAVEVDRRLAAALRERLGHLPNLELVEGDILAVDLDRLVSRRDPAEGPVKLASNLPYAITSPFLVRWLEAPIRWERAVLTLQAEVVDRLVAAPGAAAYGALTVLVAYHARVERLGTVPAGAFWPRPEVDSAVVRLWPHPRPPVAVVDPAALFALVRAAFSQRRKRLANALAAHPAVERAQAEAACRAAGIDPGTRPETVDLEGFARLANQLFPPGRPPLPGGGPSLDIMNNEH